MTPGFNLKLSVTPEGLRKLVRKNVHEKGFFYLKLHKDPESEKWTTETEWTPIHDLKGDSPEELLNALALYLTPDPPGVPLVEKDRLEAK